MQLIDTHAHIYLPEFDTDRIQMLERAYNEGVSHIFMPAIDSQTHAAMIGLEDSSCHAMMGLHPCSVGENYKTELDTVYGYLSSRSCAAVGEIGLDFYWDKSFTRQQYHAFEQQIEWAIAFDLPVVIHSRNATDECIGVVKRYPGLKGIFHCFSGTVSQAELITGMGLMLGIGGVVTYKNAGLDKVMAALGVGNVVLETDAPYLAPVPFRGKRNECSYLRHVAEKLALLSGKSLEDIAAITTVNAINLFRLSHKP